MTDRTKPEPVQYDSRICFGIAYFLTEGDAEAYAKGGTGRYNGGWFHGMACGREPQWDHTPSMGEFAGQKLFAVTTA